ncbi:hypothetical protein DY251_09735 [Mesorhizobium denitrificans]|uniref:Uncharacterized protein n=2 Tax=Mesorhizobium denitrificans TaxID=2294114 RepID=A0A371XFP7_9HYPH|nr:hypothetical protein DY251_09735 [Mesorhizobium denitrificans]
MSRTVYAMLETGLNKESSSISVHAFREFRRGKIDRIVSELRAMGLDVDADMVLASSKKPGGQKDAAVHHAVEIYVAFEQRRKLNLPHDPWLSTASKSEMVERACQCAKGSFDGDIDSDAVREAIKNLARKQRKEASRRQNKRRV